MSKRGDGAPSPDLDLDLRGLKCPLPVLRARKALAALPPGGRVRLVCTDPMAAIDIPHFVRESGHVLEHQERAEGGLVFVLRRAE
ncbi:sulfurtransferase TusA family protein [Xanthobacter pseudotagetidis]|uniref:sulfurtransferase TusA family protein n=1 Tax=Xanthobacter pseudotagetidis TaxID=3119911 RepID=UPI0037288924